MRNCLIVLPLLFCVACSNNDPVTNPPQSETNTQEMNLPVEIKRDSAEHHFPASDSDSSESKISQQPPPNEANVKTDSTEIPIEPNRNYVYKPVIYLYPENRKDITVMLHCPGGLEVSYPEYYEGWKVNATPDGKLTDLGDGRIHNYLFYECRLAKTYPMDCGFIVHSDSIIPFLQSTLREIGLLPLEYNDMISFWLPILKKNPYNAIHFSIGKEYEKTSTLTVTPTPDSQLRVMMEFVGMDAPISLPVQSLPHFERRGFTVVEWGGTEFSAGNLPVSIN